MTTIWPEDEMIPLSKQGQFIGHHILTSRRGVALHINAFNFPCWGMLEKLAPTWLAGMPIIKPATASTVNTGDGEVMVIAAWYLMAQFNWFAVVLAICLNTR